MLLLKPQGFVSIKKTKQRYLRAVSNDKERLPIDGESLNVIRFSNLQDVDVLDLDELVGRGVTFINVRAPEQLGHNDKEVVVNHHGLADHRGSTCTREGGKKT